MEIEVLVHLIYNNLLESSLYLWRSVAETYDKNSLFVGTDRGSEDIVGSGSFHADCCNDPSSYGFPPFSYCRLCDLNSVSL